MKRTFSKFLFLIYTLLFSVIIFSIGFSFNNQGNIYDLIKNNQNITIKDTSLGQWHSGAIINDGTNDKTSDHLYIWGNNEEGQLGLGPIGNKSKPTEVTGLPPGEIKQISLGKKDSAVVINVEGNDKLYTWGDNVYGQLGIGSESDKNKPTEVTGLPPGEIKQISLGFEHSAAIVSNDGHDTLYTWGRNYEGELGIDDSSHWENKPTEVKNPNNERIKQISLGGYHSLAITNDDNGDHLYSWGQNVYGQLGLGDTSNRKKPVEVTKNLPLGGNIQQIETGMQDSATIINGEPYVYGRNNDGQLGLGDNQYRNIPTKFTTPNNEKIQQFGLSNFFSFVVTNDGERDKLYAYGLNDAGQLGLGDDSKTKYNTPQEVVDLPNGKIKKISNSQGSSGGNHSIITTTINGIDHLYIWGSNSSGQLGLGTKGGFINKPTQLFPHTAKYLTNAKEIDKSYDTATISVDVAIGNNHEVEDYKLKVTDSSTNRTWISKESLTEDGTQTIELDDLYWGYDYDNLTIEIEGLESSQISIDEFTTEDSPITPDETSFKIDDKSITKKSFVFSIGINFVEGYKVEDFDPSILTLTSNGKDLKLNFLHSGDGDIYTYKAFDLKSHNVYDNFEVGIKNAPNLHLKINTNPIKTKKNIAFILEISFTAITFIVIIIIIIMVTFIIMRKKRGKDDFAGFSNGNSFF